MIIVIMIIIINIRVNARGQRPGQRGLGEEPLALRVRLLKGN